MDPGQVLTRSRQKTAEETPAFGGIAERFRRAGDLDRAVTLCREGLQKFPEHLSARVTLGWALLDLRKYDEAQVELEQVLKRAPDNLAAIRGLAELHERAENAVEISLEGPGPWPPDADTIKAAAPAAAAGAHAAHAPATAGETPAPDTEPAIPVVEPRAVAAPAAAAPVAAPPIVEAPAPPSSAELKAFADLITEPASDAPAATVVASPAAAAIPPGPPAELAEPSEEDILKALDELEGNAQAGAPVEVAATDVPDVPVLIEPVLDEPVLDDLVGALESAKDTPAVAVMPAKTAATAAEVYETAPVELESASAIQGTRAAKAETVTREPEVATPELETTTVERQVAPTEAVQAAEVQAAEVQASGVPAAEVEVAEVKVAEAEVAEVEAADSFKLTAEIPSEAVAQDDAAVAETAGLPAAGDTDSRSFDFETPVEVEAAAPEPVPAGPPPMPVRTRAAILKLERMLTRIQTRRVEVASEYHRAS